MEITEKKQRDLQLTYCRDVNCKRSIVGSETPAKTLLVICSAVSASHN